MTTGMTTAEKDALDETQATFERAYIVTVPVLEATNNKDVPQRFYKDATLAKSDYVKKTGETTDETLWNAISSSVAEAYVVTKTIQLSKTDYIYRNSYMTAAEIATIKGKVSSDIATEIDKVVVPAYYCTEAGKYGGNYYETGHNYRALAAYSAMSKSDREKFTFNYDALDLLIDPYYSKNAAGTQTLYGEGKKYQYDGNYTTENAVKDLTNGNKAQYSLATSIDYSATYKGTTSLTYTADDNSSKTATDGTVLSRSEYERLPNEQYYWAPITVDNTSNTYYVVKQTIILGDTPYAAGQVISQSTYDGLGGSDQAKVAKLTFTSTGDYYYCREGYTINSSSYADDDVNKGKVTDILKTDNNVYNTSVPAGIVISSDNYNELINKQKNFAIHGLAPTETSSLYVTGGSDIFDLSAEKIITVVYHPRERAPCAEHPPELQEWRAHRGGYPSAKHHPAGYHHQHCRTLRHTWRLRGYR